MFGRIYVRLMLAGILALAPKFAAGQTTYFREIKPLLAEKCVGCHQVGGIGPFALDTLAKVTTYGQAVQHAINSQRMPPWLADPGHQTYQDDLSLSAAQRQLILDWFAAGMRPGDPDDYSAPQRRTFTADEQHPIFGSGTSYLPRQDQADDYRCFLVPAGEQSRFMTGFSAKPGNTKIVHHLVAYAADAEMQDLLAEFAADEAGVGYECFGGALPDRLGDPKVWRHYEARYPDIMADIRQHYFWLAHWAPGMDGGFVLPTATGARIPAGGTFIVQIHYYSAHAKGEVDRQTAMALMTQDTVAKPGFYYPLTKGSWLRGKGYMEIPPGRQVTYATALDLASIASYGQRILKLKEPPQALEVHSANLHMHSVGHSGKVTLQDPLGHEETLLSISRWDLGWQRDFLLSVPKVIARDDWSDWHQGLTCHYYNHGPGTVYGGLGSKDEMCFNFGFYAFQP